MSKTGYVEGQNIIFEYRWAEGHYDRLPALAAELVARHVSVIVPIGGAPATVAARQATMTIPIVFAIHADPVGIGHVARLSHPGGNITGLTMLLSDLAVKELEILKEAVPHATWIGIVWNPTTPSHAAALPAIKAAGKKLGVALQIEPVSRIEELEAAFVI